MNDHPSDRDPGYQTIEQLLSHLKQVEPPLESRVANRAAVAAEITRITARRREQVLPFWLRPVAIPWPVAATVLATLVTLSLMSFRSGRQVLPVAAPSTIGQEDGESVDPLIPHEVTPFTKTPTLAYYETTTYLCGIGQLRSEAKYLLEE